jgi:hypothetical protein
MTPDSNHPPSRPLAEATLRVRAEAFDVYDWLLAEARWWAEVHRDHRRTNYATVVLFPWEAPSREST